MDLKRSWKYGEESYILKTAESSYRVEDEKKYVVTEKKGKGGKKKRHESR